MTSAAWTALGSLRLGAKIATTLALAATGFLATPAAAVIQSWNGYKWARTGPLAIQIGNNLTGAWSPLFAPNVNAWSAANNIDFVASAGRATSSACGAVYGTVQVCNGSYGFNGWLGFANVWLSRGFIVQATVRLNDSYFASAKFNTAGWRNMVLCQEIGHTLGLAHTNTNRNNLNTGSCMDYTNDPTGTAGGPNGTLANLTPNSVDFAALDGIYANLDTTQLIFTRPTQTAGHGFSVEDDDHIHTLTGVPEPANWALLIAGFGSIGAAMRRRRAKPALRTASA
jgi:hypothetical protein